MLSILYVTDAVGLRGRFLPDRCRTRLALGRRLRPLESGDTVRAVGLEWNLIRMGIVRKSLIAADRIRRCLLSGRH